MELTITTTQYALIFFTAALAVTLALAFLVALHFVTTRGTRDRPQYTIHTDTSASRYLGWPGGQHPPAGMPGWREPNAGDPSSPSTPGPSTRRSE